MKKIVFAGAAVLLLAAGCSSKGTTTLQTQIPAPAPQPPAQQTATSTPAAAPQPENYQQDSLESSLNSVDTQLNALSTDSANADASLNEQQAP